MLAPRTFTGLDFEAAAETYNLFGFQGAQVSLATDPDRLG